MTSERPEQRPLVSVVIIYRDAEQFLADAIDSVLAQTYAPVELILVDDASADASSEIGRARADAAPERVRLLAHPDGRWQGMSASRNLGIREARGEIITFLDADDYWDPTHLEQSVSLLLRHPEAAMVCGRAVTWRSWERDGTDESSPLAFAPGVVVPPPQMLTASLRRGAYAVPICALTVRRDALIEVGGAEGRFAGMYEDQALLAKLHLRFASVLSGALTAHYRQHPGSASARAQSAGEYDPSAPNLSRLTYLRWLRDLVQSGDHANDTSLTSALEADLARELPAERGPDPVGATRRFAERVAHRLLATTAPVDPARRLVPRSRRFGYEHGQPIDRWYIEQFLAENGENIRGRVLEIGDRGYTQRFGGTRVAQSDVLNREAGDPETTFVADLADAPELPASAFDCLIVTQTLHLVFDMARAVQTMYRILRPGGTALVTVPGISQLSADRWRDTWYWSLTPNAAERLFGDVFGDHSVEVKSSGNVLSACAFLQGLTARDFSRDELDFIDLHYPLVVTIRALREADG